MPSLTEQDFVLLQKIDDQELGPFPSNHIVRLELLGLVRDDSSGIRLSVAGREVLRLRPPPPLTAAPELLPEPDSDVRNRKRKERLDSIF